MLVSRLVTLVAVLSMVNAQTPTPSPGEDSSNLKSVILFIVLCVLVVGVFLVICRKCRKRIRKKPPQELAVQLKVESPDPSSEITLPEIALQPMHEIAWTSLSNFRVVGRGAFGIVKTAWSSVTREQVWLPFLCGIQCVIAVIKIIQTDCHQRVTR